ncbi:MAG: glutathione S-transferase family protein [Woeseiaceae bacterium]
MSDYTIYGGEESYFTRKLEAAMRFYGADFTSKRKRENPQAEIRSGTHQIPVLHTPEDWMIADTTPLLHLLDSRFPDRAMFPAGPLGVLVHIVEEYFDEWVARTMVHYRWHYPESAAFAAPRIAAGDKELEEKVLNWGPRSCRATGTESEHQQKAAENEYLRILEAAEAQLQETAFLLGERPTAVDCIVLGGLRAHTYHDPVPKRVVENFPTVVDWLGNRADAWHGGGELAPFPDSTAFARTVLAEMATSFKPFVLGNRDAQRTGDKAFVATIYDEDVSYLSRAYPETSRQMIIKRIAELANDDREAVNAWLSEIDLLDIFKE